ncbi:MAG: glycosyltransferase [Cyclobacteriaceae bacterium]
MPSAKVCAVIVTFNGIKWIEKCIDSLEKSTVKVDIFVIDNGSTDGTFQYLQKRDCCKFLHQAEENLGFGKANNIAIKQGYNQDYEFFLLLNQDAWIEENVIEDLILKMHTETGYGISSPLHFNGGGTALDTLFESYLSRMDSYQKDLNAQSVKDQLYTSRFINAACWLLTRNTLKEVGLFHPLFDHYGEDDNYLDRLHFMNLKLGLAPNIKVYHDRENSGVNSLKNDPDRLYKRTIMRYLLDPSRKEHWIQSLQQSSKISKKISKQFSGFSKFRFRIRCFFKYYEISSTVKNFERNRKSELHVH